MARGFALSLSGLSWGRRRLPPSKLGWRQQPRLGREDSNGDYNDVVIQSVDICVFQRYVSPSISTAATFLGTRRDHSLSRLSSFAGRVAKIRELKKFSHFSIYVTGSYGRLEASGRSDLDLFFILNDSNSKTRPIDRLSKVLIDAALIKISDRMGFPAFSNDGQYLEIHPLSDIVNSLGGPEDDYKNHFTARMLLLLESRPIYNPKAYSEIIRGIIKSYFRDYHDHQKDFRPIFLVNDILRFWKTMCLNYENKRNISTSDPTTKRKNHLRNLKLKFSRLMTCFSTVIPLCSMKFTNPAQIQGLVELPPVQRLEGICIANEEDRNVMTELLDHYTWFLRHTSRADILDWMGKKTNRDMAFQRAREFGRDAYSLLERTAHREILRYLII